MLHLRYPSPTVPGIAHRADGVMVQVALGAYSFFPPGTGLGGHGGVALHSDMQGLLGGAEEKREARERKTGGGGSGSGSGSSPPFQEACRSEQKPPFFFAFLSRMLVGRVFSLTFELRNDWLDGDAACSGRPSAA